MSDYPEPLSHGSLWADALAMEIELRPLDAQKIVSGNSRCGSVSLARTSQYEVGVWEITPGVSTDIEADEIFVVISGEAILTRGRGQAGTAQQLRPGVVVRLEAGEHTTWDVRETLRKIYWISAD